MIVGAKKPSMPTRKTGNRSPVEKFWPGCGVLYSGSGLPRVTSTQHQNPGRKQAALLGGTGGDPHKKAAVRIELAVT